MADFSIQIKARPEDLFAYVADFTKHPEWSPDDMKMEALTPGPTRVGSKFKAEGTLQGKRNPSEVVVTAYDPPRRLAFTATDARAPLQHTFTFTPKDGGTWVNRHLEPPSALIGKILMVILMPIAIRPNFTKALELLKQRVEARRS